MKQIVIDAQHVSKTFMIPHEKISTIRAAFVNLHKKKTYETFNALSDISFQVKKGEFLGIIGRNGSGKSTLLKILAGIYTADKGKVTVNGLISPFLELGIGFNAELSGRDNIYLNAAVLGLSRKEIDQKFKSIVAFSELERFIDQKIKNYSSGMQVRLAFSVAIHANREILLMDEVLAVGDANFQQKCLEEFSRYRELNKTVILVTHDIATVQRYCDRALLLRNGEVQIIGDPDDVVAEYTRQNMSDAEQRVQKEHDQDQKKGSSAQQARAKRAEITNVEFLDEDGEPKTVFRTGDALTARIHYDSKIVIEKPVFGIALHTQDGVHLSGPNTKTSKFNIEKIEGKGWIDFMIPKTPFLPGRYYFTAALFNWDCTIPFDFHDRAFSFKMISHDINQYGLIKLSHIWSASDQQNKN